MSAPAAPADLSLPAQAVYVVLCALLSPDTPCELTMPQIAKVGGFAPRRLRDSLSELERAGLIQCIHAAPGCPPAIIRPSTPLSTPADPAGQRTPIPRADVPLPRSVTDALCGLLGAHPVGTVLTTSTRELAAAIGRPDSGQVRVVLGRLIQAGLVERLPGRALRLRLCGPLPASEGRPAPSGPVPTVLAQVRAALRGQPLGVELPITVKELATATRRGQMSIVRALRTLEAEGTIRRTCVGRRTGLIILSPVDPPPAQTSAAPPRATSPPALPHAQRLTPHAALWQHLRASQQQRRNLTDWLLSGLTVTVLPDSTVLTCVDAVRTSLTRAWHRTLTCALRAQKLPPTLVIRQAPADAAPALPPGALDAALAAGSVGALLDAVQPLPNLSEQEARALLAQFQAGQAAQERQIALRQPCADLAQAVVAGYAAWEWMILSYLRLVVRIARRHPSPCLSLEERVQAGVLGLIQAVAQCDGKLSRSFLLFAYRAAHRAIHDALEAEQPIRRTRSRRRAMQAQRELAASLGRAPTVEEIARCAGMLPSTVVAVLDAEAGVASLDAPLRVDEEQTLADLVADDQALMPEAVIIARETVQARRKVLSSALAGLAPDVRRVIALRFGLEGEACGVREVATVLGWTVPQVRRVEAEALAALRKGMRVEEQHAPEAEVERRNWRVADSEPGC